jgi:CubicO group peptidase (beta-lactamase class C family)
MNCSLIIFVVIIFFTSCGKGITEDAWKDDHLKSFTPKKKWDYFLNPADAGWSNDALKEIKTKYNDSGASSLMVIYKGRVLIDWGRTKRKFDVRSIRKPLLTSVIGSYVDEGKLDIYKTLNDFGIDDKGRLTKEEKSARLIDLIKFRSGIYHPTLYAGRNQIKMRPKRGSHKPNEHFFYNNWDVHASTMILEKATGKPYELSFSERIANRIFMEDYIPSDYMTEVDSTLSYIPGALTRMSTRDLARFGLLYLNEGRWNENQILSKRWVNESTKQHSYSAKEGVAMGYMWTILPKKLRAKFGSAIENVEIFAAIGRGAQVLFIIPQLDLIVVQRANLNLDLTEENENIVAKGKNLRKKPVLELLNHIVSAKIKKAKKDVEVYTDTHSRKHAFVSEEYVGVYPYNIFKSFQIRKTRHSKYIFGYGNNKNWKTDLYHGAKNLLKTEDENVLIKQSKTVTIIRIMFFLFLIIQ